VYTWNNISFIDAGNGSSYFTFLTALDAVNGEWDGANQGDRYGAPEKDTPIKVGETSPIKLYAVNVSAMAAESWMVAPGTFNIVANLKDMTVEVKLASSGIENVNSMDETPVYINMQGVRVEHPESGLYIVVRGNKVTKEIVK
ncbi:MAG: hypothetical protein K2M03_06605, partial [Muribaculaceae bacterium]|nr:hypothetical protein [Muribaculaceae bacterium]